MQARGIQVHLHLQPGGPNRDQFYMLDAPYVLFATDQARVLRVLKNLRTPTNYVAARHAKINKGRLSGLKSHDYHILMQQVLPLCFRRVANKALARAVIRLRRVLGSYARK